MTGRWLQGPALGDDGEAERILANHHGRKIDRHAVPAVDAVNSHGVRRRAGVRHVELLAIRRQRDVVGVGSGTVSTTASVRTSITERVPAARLATTTRPREGALSCAFARASVKAGVEDAAARRASSAPASSGSVSQPVMRRARQSKAAVHKVSHEDNGRRCGFPLPSVPAPCHFLTVRG